MAIWLFRQKFGLCTAAITAAFLVNAPAVVADGSSQAAPLMRMIKSGRVPPARIGRIVELACARGDAEDLGYIFQQTVKKDGFAKDLRLQTLDWLAEAALNRKVIPSGDLSGLGRLFEVNQPKTDKPTQLAAIRLAGILRVKELSQPLSAIALDADLGMDVRQSALQALVEIGDPAARETVDQLLATNRTRGERSLGVVALTRLDLDSAAEAAVDVLIATQEGESLAQLIDAFLDRKAGAEKLAAAISGRTLQADVAKLVLRHIYSVGRTDAGLVAVLSKAAGLNTATEPLSPEEVKQLAAQVQAEGDPARGEDIFRRADLSCMKCHSVSKAGGQIGPDLSAVGASSPVDYLLNSILVPNQAIKEAFLTRVVLTEAGKIYQGIVVDRDQQRLILKDATGKQISIPIADIDDEEEGQSLMPQGLTKFLTRRELIDLVRFLSELGKPGEYAVRKRPTIQRWRLLSKLPAALTDGGVEPELLREELSSLNEEAWQPVYAKVAGNLPFGELNSLSPLGTKLLLQAEFNVTVAGPIGFRIQTPGSTQAAIDDGPLRSDQEFTAELPRGHHRLLLILDTHAQATGDLRAELYRVEGSPAEFEVVGGR